jgi:hypothetical protein
MDVFAQEAWQSQQTIDLFKALTEVVPGFADAIVATNLSQPSHPVATQTGLDRRVELNQSSTLNHLTLFASGTCARLENTDLAWQMLVLEDWRTCIMSMFQPSATNDLPFVVNTNDDCLDDNHTPLTNSNESLESNDDTETCSPWSTASEDGVSIEWQLALSEIYVNEYEDLIFQLVFSASTDMDPEMARMLAEVTTQHAFDLTQYRHCVFHHNMLIVRPSD